MHKDKLKIFYLNKTGAEKIFSVYWFAILILVAGGIFGMVYTFYNHPYDVRQVEANILINNIADCLSGGGYLREEIFNDGNFSLNQNNFLETCNLNFESGDLWGEEQYYVEINFYGLANLEKSFFNVTGGNKKWLASCEIQKDKEYAI